MKKLKIFSALLALVMIVSLVLVSCGGSSGTETSENGGVQSETKEQENPNEKWDYEVKDLQGHDFLFLVHDTRYFHLNTDEVYAEQLTGDKVNDAVFKRNAALQEKFNCTVSEERSENVVTTAREPLLAGEYVYDFIYGRVQQLRTLASASLLVDFSHLENLDLDKVWWDQNLRVGLTIRDHLFYINGDAGTIDDRATWVMYFNRDLMDRNKIEDLYAVVERGEWTIEKMYEVGQACWSDEDGDGVFLPKGTDIASYMGEVFNNWVHVAACGAQLSTIASSGDIALPGTVNENCLNVWSELKPLLTDPHRDVSDAGSRFQKGKAAFFGVNLGGILTFADASINFGVLPFPKRNVEQEKYWTTFGQHLMVCYSIPTTTDQIDGYQKAGFSSGSEMCAYFLEAFAYESRSTLTPAFYDQVLRKQSVRDVESVEMIDLSVQNRVYDPVVIYNFGSIGSIFASCGSDGHGGTSATDPLAVGSDANYDKLVSMYESRLESARKSLNNYLRFLEDLDETA